MFLFNIVSIDMLFIYFIFGIFSIILFINVVSINKLYEGSLFKFSSVSSYSNNASIIKLFNFGGKFDKKFINFSLFSSFEKSYSLSLISTVHIVIFVFLNIEKSFIIKGFLSLKSRIFSVPYISLYLLYVSSSFSYGSFLNK